MRRRVFSVLAAAAAVSSVLAAPMTSATAADVPRPGQDPFYAWDQPLDGVAPGAVLRERSVTVGIADAVPAVPATQVLYRTTDQLGRPSVTVATVIKPLANAGATKIVSYQVAYDGLADICRPSFQLIGGSPSAGSTYEENPFILSYLQQGYTVVTADYEGEADHFGAGREEGKNTLDAIRAAEHSLQLPASTPVGLVGYSGGALASEWAAQQQASYAPELHLSAVSAGGVGVDFAHNLDYINGSTDWAGAIPAISLGLLRAYGVNLNKYASAYGKTVINEVQQGCLNPGGYPGLTFESLLAPRYQNWKQIPIFVRIFNDSIMGRSGKPLVPLFMGDGNADGTGDGVIVVKDVQQLAYQYCQRHVHVQLDEYPQLNHVQSVPLFEAHAAAFLQAVETGVTTDNCASITPGNPLTPLPRPTQ